MRTFFLVITFNLFLASMQAQKCIEIPEFKNIDLNDNYPERTMIASLINDYDILISLKNYSNWGPDTHVEVLACNRFAWYKIEITSSKFWIDTLRTGLTTLKLKNNIGDSVWNILKENHLFDMQDGRTKKISCEGKEDTIIENGKQKIIKSTFDVDDGSEYEFEILTKDKYKKLYFYEPKEFNENCKKVQERTWIINCINIFEKYLGK